MINYVKALPALQEAKQTLKFILPMPGSNKEFCSEPCLTAYRFTIKIWKPIMQVCNLGNCKSSKVKLRLPKQQGLLRKEL